MRDGKKNRKVANKKYLAALEAARTHFLAHGYERTSMDAIAHEAGISKATIYAYFENKEVLLKELIENECALYTMNILENIEFPIKDIHESLVSIAKNFTRIFLSDRGVDFQRLVISNARQFPEVTEVFLKNGPLHKREQLAYFMTKAIQEHKMQIDDMDLAVSQFMGLVAADLPLRWMLKISPPTQQEYDLIINSGVDVFLKSYGTTK